MNAETAAAHADAIRHDVMSELYDAAPKVLQDWLTGNQTRYNRLEKLVVNAILAANGYVVQQVVGYTTAPVDYDHGYTETLETFDLPDDYSPNRTHHWRKVAINDVHRAPFQTQRYGSGNHPWTTEDPRVYAAEYAAKKAVWKRDAEAKNTARDKLDEYAKQGKRDRIYAERDTTFRLLEYEVVDRAARTATANAEEHRKETAFRMLLDKTQTAMQGKHTGVITYEPNMRGWPADDRNRPTYLLNVTLPNTRHHQHVSYAGGGVSLETFYLALQRGTVLPIDLDVPQEVALAANKHGARGPALGLGIIEGAATWAIPKGYVVSEYVGASGRAIPKNTKRYAAARAAEHRIKYEERR